MPKHARIYQSDHQCSLWVSHDYHLNLVYCYLRVPPSIFLGTSNYRPRAQILTVKINKVQ